MNDDWFIYIYWSVIFVVCIVFFGIGIGGYGLFGSLGVLLKV